MINPYKSPEPDPEPIVRQSRWQVSIDWHDFFVYTIVVIIGTPILYPTIQELIERFL